MDEAERLLEEFEKASAPSNYDTTAYAACRDAVLAAMRKGGVPEGWQLVPKVPTEEMKAAVLAIESWIQVDEGDGPSTVGMCDGLEAWDEMLAVAPQPPALDRDGVIEACAKVAQGDWLTSKLCEEIAAAIRAMKGQS
jgi:hypothetical protein